MYLGSFEVCASHPLWLRLCRVGIGAATASVLTLAAVTSRGGLVGRVRRILDEHTPRPAVGACWALLTGTAALVAAGAVALAQERPTNEGAKAPAVLEEKPDTPRRPELVQAKSEKANKLPIFIEGKPLAEWRTSLKDRDPAVRKRAVEVLGNVTQDQAGDQWFQLPAEINGVMLSDKDPGVRDAAATASVLLRVSSTATTRAKPMNPPSRTINGVILDFDDNPVSGAVVVGGLSGTGTPNHHVLTTDSEGRLSWPIPAGGTLVSLYAHKPGRAPTYWTGWLDAKKAGDDIELRLGKANSSPSPPCSSTVRTSPSSGPGSELRCAPITTSPSGPEAAPLGWGRDSLITTLRSWEAARSSPFSSRRRTSMGPSRSAPLEPTPGSGSR